MSESMKTALLVFAGVVVGSLAPLLVDKMSTSKKSDGLSSAKFNESRGSETMSSFDLSIGGGGWVTVTIDKLRSVACYSYDRKALSCFKCADSACSDISK